MITPVDTACRAWLALVILLASCSVSDPEANAHEAARSDGSSSCSITLKKNAIYAPDMSELAAFLRDVFKADENVYVSRLRFSDLQTIVLSRPMGCTAGSVQGFSTAVSQGLKRHALAYSIGKPHSEPTVLHRVPPAVATLPELLASVSSNQAKLENCVFVFQTQLDSLGSIEEEQRFRGELDATKSFGVPLLYDLQIDGKMHIVFYDQCSVGLKMMAFVQAIVNHSKTERLSNPRLATSEEVKRLIHETGGRPSA